IDKLAAKKGQDRSAFIRGALREKIERDAPKLYAELFDDGITIGRKSSKKN
ncbi:unnamed protein product, partial [marine sediment metagenome]